MKSHTMKRIAVIGAGAAGLISLRHLLKKPELYEPVVYEATGKIGGTWKYTDTDDQDPDRPVHGAVYQNLLTNLPKEVMNFPDMLFEENNRSFISHSEVLMNIENYAKINDLYKYIKFHHYVEKISRPDGTDKQWCIEAQNGDNSVCEKTYYDAVFVCNGHYSVPYWPDIPGMKDFTGTIIHSKSYRKPEPYTGKTVAILGARPSGQDISVDLSTVAKRVILSHRDCPLDTPMPDNVHQTLGIVQFTKTGIVFEDGTSEDNIDHVILCTGYQLSFPFLDDSCGINVHDGRVYPVYKHIVNVNHPSMFFIGICSVIAPIQHFDVQVRYCLAILDGKFLLPQGNEMMKWIDEDFAGRMAAGMKHKYAHLLARRQWEYADNIALEAGIDKILPVIKELYDHVHTDRHNNVLIYRSRNYKIVNDHQFKLV